MNTPNTIEEAAALKIHHRAITAGKNYANEHGHSIIEEVAYGRGYKSGYMQGSKEMYDKMCEWLKTNVAFTNFDQLKDAMCKNEN